MKKNLKMLKYFEKVRMLGKERIQENLIFFICMSFLRDLIKLNVPPFSSMPRRCEIVGQGLAAAPGVGRCGGPVQRCGGEGVAHVPGQ